MAVSSDTTHRRFAASKQCIMAGNQTGKEHLPWMRGKATCPPRGGGRDHKETIKRLILLQLGRVESAKTLDEVKKITQDLAGAFQD